jgi:hypothetical protein
MVAADVAAVDDFFLPMRTMIMSMICPINAGGF